MESKLRGELKKLRSEGVHLPGDVPAGTLCWLMFHGELLSVSFMPMSERVEDIKGYKPPREILTRLRWMRPVWGELPKSVTKAGREVVRAREAHEESLEEVDYLRLDRANDKWKRAVKRCRKSIEKLHAKECPGCPWDGETLFPLGKQG